MLFGPALNLLERLPPVPSLVPIYKSTQTTTANETVTTWTGVDIGTPHPKRVVCAALYKGHANLSGMTIGGQYAPVYWFGSGHECAIHAARVPGGDTADIVASVASSQLKACSIFVLYPNDFTTRDFAASATTTNNATVTPQVRKNGSLIYCGVQHSTLGAFSTTWSGAEAVTESVDAQLEANASYTMGMIPLFLTSQVTSVLTLAETVSGTKRLVAVPFGPAYGND
jgi:hypothetical protein